MSELANDLRRLSQRGPHRDPDEVIASAMAAARATRLSGLPEPDEGRPEEEATEVTLTTTPAPIRPGAPGPDAPRRILLPVLAAAAILILIGGFWFAGRRRRWLHRRPRLTRLREPPSRP